MDKFFKKFQKSFGKLQKSERGHTQFLRGNTSLGNFTFRKTAHGFSKNNSKFRAKKKMFQSPYSA